MARTPKPTPEPTEPQPVDSDGNPIPPPADVPDGELVDTSTISDPLPDDAVMPDTSTISDPLPDDAVMPDTSTLGDAPDEQTEQAGPDAAPGEHAPPGYVWIKRPRTSVTLGAYNALHDGPVLIDEKSLPELAAQGWVVVE